MPNRLRMNSLFYISKANYNPDFVRLIKCKFLLNFFIFFVQVFIKYLVLLLNTFE